jgi:hypothetical protein
MPPQNPLTRLRQLALDLERLSLELEGDTEFDPAVFRYLRSQLVEIAAEIEQAGAELTPST